MENNNLLPEKDTKIQLVVNNPDSEEDTIDLGRVFHNMRVKSRIFALILKLSAGSLLQIRYSVLTEMSISSPGTKSEPFART